MIDLYIFVLYGNWIIHNRGRGGHGKQQFHIISHSDDNKCIPKTKIIWN